MKKLLSVLCVSALLPVAACGSEDATDSPRDGDSSDDLGFGSPERKAVVAAIHRDFLDADVHGQPNELVISNIRADNNYAFVTASVQKKGGGDIDWSDSEYAADVAEGLFDGPHLEALVFNQEGDWSVVAHGIGSTDVWWFGLWNRFAAPCSLFSILDGNCTPPAEPARGTADRKAITGAVHADFLDAAVNGQANELVISWLRADDRYAWIQAKVQKKGGGELDWENSIFADDVRDGLFDGPRLEAFLEFKNGSWSVAGHGIGSTDVWWDGIWNGFDDVQCALFDQAECHP